MTTAEQCFSKFSKTITITCLIPFHDILWVWYPRALVWQRADVTECKHLRCLPWRKWVDTNN